MTIGRFATIVVLSLAPLAAQAEGCWEERQAMSCPTGQVWDKAAKACVVHSS
ncbi:hypothetical protein [Phaeovulum veldkampii]|uniref:hypothetical protein n=1 Tax=Phaeovulum veldkampii TaxID=33049 RepID=UPI0010D2F489|nr:hypothetical protein [Phaeovulum veldkampii]TDQ59182.1 hypothetical protein EV658_10960 [Phaeovulum veldkampii DSM 11550]